MGINTFLRYVVARYDREQRELMYRIYVTDALKLLGGINLRYADVITEQKPLPKAADAVNKIRSKLGGIGGE